MFPSSEPRRGPRAVIVASGPSARGFVPPDDVTIIAVNGAIEWLFRADYFFTLDPDPTNLTRLNNPRSGVSYFAAVPDAVDLPTHVHRLKRVERRGPEPMRRHSPAWWLWRWSCVKELSEISGEIHSGNSAWGALGLAYQLGFRDVALVGVDASSDERIEGGRCNNLTHLPPLFASALPQINVVSCGKLTSIPQITFEEWIMR